MMTVARVVTPREDISLKRLAIAPGASKYREIILTNRVKRK